MAHDTDLTQGRIAVPVWERYTLAVEEAPYISGSERTSSAG